MAEGRRVLGNIERTSGLYLTKTVYAMLLSLAVGVAGLVFPFLPRHLTLIGALTIGIPSFFLALAPNTDLFRPGFVPRVLRFAIPAGTLAAIATFLGYSLAREEPGVSPPAGADHGRDGAHLDRAAGAVDRRGAAHPGAGSR